MRMALIGLLLTALSTVAAAHPAPDFSCAMRATSNGWCDGCKVGYVATVEVRSAELFESLDVHGHDVPGPDGMDCPVCRRAYAKDAYCGDCRIGFEGGHAYFTALTWHLARGETRDPATISCAACRKAAADTTTPLTDHWCDACGHGMVGNVEIRDKMDYAAARKQFERLLRAVKELDRCETCALAMFHDGNCRACNVTYRKGDPVERKPAQGK